MNNEKIETIDDLAKIINATNNLRRNLYYALDYEVLTEEQNNRIEKAIDSSFDLQAEIEELQKELIKEVKTSLKLY